MSNPAKTLQTTLIANATAPPAPLTHAEVRAFKARHGVNQDALAEALNIPSGTFSNMLQGRGTLPSWVTRHARRVMKAYVATGELTPIPRPKHDPRRYRTGTVYHKNTKVDVEPPDLVTTKKEWVDMPKLQQRVVALEARVDRLERALAKVYSWAEALK